MIEQAHCEMYCKHEQRRYQKTKNTYYLIVSLSIHSQRERENKTKKFEKKKRIQVTVLSNKNLFFFFPFYLSVNMIIVENKQTNTLIIIMTIVVGDEVNVMMHDIDVVLMNHLHCVAKNYHQHHHPYHRLFHHHQQWLGECYSNAEIMNSIVEEIYWMNDELNWYYAIFDGLLHDVYVHPIEQNDDHMYHMRRVFLERSSNEISFNRLL